MKLLQDLRRERLQLLFPDERHNPLQQPALEAISRDFLYSRLLQEVFFDEDVDELGDGDIFLIGFPFIPLRAVEAFSALVDGFQFWHEISS